MTLVVLPHPLALRRLAKIVAQREPQEVAVPSRVERHRSFDDLVERLHRLLVRRERGDLLRAGRPSLGPDVDEHEALEPLAVTPGPRERVGTAERHAHEHEPIETEMIDERLEVADVALRPVGHHRRPFALAVSALIERHTVALATKTAPHEIPRAGV